MIFLKYNRSTYLHENLAVAQTVTSGIIPNGFEHWVKFAFIEKRTCGIFLLAVVNVLYRGRCLFHFFA
jgi:hypothetical protein